MTQAKPTGHKMGVFSHRGQIFWKLRGESDFLQWVGLCDAGGVWYDDLNFCSPERNGN